MNSKNQADQATRGFFNFKIKSPISHFKTVFKKEVEQQWTMAFAMFIQLIVQAINYGFLIFTQKTLTVRMEIAHDEHRRALWALMFHMVAWVFLCYLRKKHFTIPKLLGFLTFNIFAISFFYLQSYMLCANTLGDPNSKIIFQSIVLNDAFFGFGYVALSDFVHPTGFFGFTTFPKFFFSVCFYFFFDDRGTYIIQTFLLTTLTAFLTGLVAEELVSDCYHEEITEFGVLDHYILLFLDYPYMIKRSYHALVDIVQGYKERMYSVKKQTDEDSDGDADKQAGGDDKKQKKE